MRSMQNAVISKIVMAAVGNSTLKNWNHYGDGQRELPLCLDVFVKGLSRSAVSMRRMLNLDFLLWRYPTKTETQIVILFDCQYKRKRWRHSLDSRAVKWLVFDSWSIPVKKSFLFLFWMECYFCRFNFSFISILTYILFHFTGRPRYTRCACCSVASGNDSIQHSLL